MDLSYYIVLSVFPFSMEYFINFISESTVVKVAFSNREQRETKLVSKTLMYCELFL